MNSGGGYRALVEAQNLRMQAADKKGVEIEDDDDAGTRT